MSKNEFIISCGAGISACPLVCFLPCDAVEVVRVAALSPRHRALLGVVRLGLALDARHHELVVADRADVVVDIYGQGGRV